MPSPLTAPLLRWLGRLSYPKLFMLTSVLFLATLVVPDPLPFVDELLLGLGAMMIAKRKRPPTQPPRGGVIDGQARRG